MTTLETSIGKPPYDDPDSLELMRSDAGLALGTIPHDGPKVPTETGADARGFEVPSDAVALGELHFYLE